MSDEDRLRERLRSAAERVPDLTDLDDVAVRLGHRRPGRERRLVASVVLVLVAGVVAGVALGVNRGGGGHSLTVGAAETTTVPKASGSSGQGRWPQCSSHPQPLVEPLRPQGTPTTECSAPTEPPPTLPAPGAEQPADPVAARRLVENAFTEAFDGQIPDGMRASAIEGGAGLTSVFDELRAGPNGPAVQRAKTIVDGIVFLSPTSAAVEFHAELGAGSASGPYIGDAVLNGAVWQVSRASYCRLVALAGTHCPE